MDNYNLLSFSAVEMELKVRVKDKASGEPSEGVELHIKDKDGKDLAKAITDKKGENANVVST